MTDPCRLCNRTKPTVIPVGLDAIPVCADCAVKAPELWEAFTGAAATIGQASIIIDALAREMGLP